MSTPVSNLTQEFIDAANAVYTHFDTTHSIGALTPLTGLNGIAIASLNEAHGFYAQAYSDTQGNVIVAFEGVYDGNGDAYYNGTVAASKDLERGLAPKAFADAIAFTNMVHQLYSAAPIYVAGHSLGGAEAQAVASNLSFISGGMTFGAPGIPAAGSVAPTNFVNYVEYLDPIGNAANDGRPDPFYNYTLIMGPHYGPVTYIGSNASQIVSYTPLVGNLTLGALFLTAYKTIFSTFHALDIYAGDLNKFLHSPVAISQQHATIIAAPFNSELAQQAVAQASVVAATPSLPSYPKVTNPSAATALTNTATPLSSWFSASEVPAASSHHIDHYTAFVVRGTASIIVGGQAHALGSPATNISPAQFATATFSAGSNSGTTEIAVIAFDDLGNQSIAGDLVVTVTAPPSAPQAVVPTDHTPPTIVAGQQLVTGVGSNPDLTSAYLQVIDTNSAHYTPEQLTYTIVSTPSHGYLLKGGSIVNKFTQADINNRLVEYQENGSIAPSDSFTYFVSDPAGNRTPNATFNISINTPPTTTHPTLDTNAALSVGQGQTALITSSNLHVTDAGLNSWQVIYTVTGGGSHGRILAGGVNVVQSFTQQQGCIPLTKLGWRTSVLPNECWSGIACLTMTERL